MSAEKLLTDIQQQHEVTQVLKALLEDEDLIYGCCMHDNCGCVYCAVGKDASRSYRTLLKRRLFGEGT